MKTTTTNETMNIGSSILATLAGYGLNEWACLIGLIIGILGFLITKVIQINGRTEEKEFHAVRMRIAQLDEQERLGRVVLMEAEKRVAALDEKWQARQERHSQEE